MAGMRPWTPFEAVREPQEIGRRLRGAANTRELRDRIRIDAQVVEGFHDALRDGVVAATGAQRSLAAPILQNLQPDVIDLLGRRVHCRAHLFALLTDDLVGHSARIEWQTAVISQAAQFGDDFRIEVQAHQTEQLRVAVLVHYIYPVVPGDEIE